MATMKVAEAQLAQVVADHPNLFPNPDYLEDSDRELLDFNKEEV